MPWDALVKLLEASNKFLFGGTVVGLLIWFFRDQLGFDPITANVAGLVGLFCLCALVWEAAVAIIAWVKRTLEESAAKKEAERVLKQMEDAQAAKRAEVLRRIERLSPEAKATLSYMLAGYLQEITEDSDNRVLVELYQAELVSRTPTNATVLRSHFRMHDFVWSHLSQPENAKALKGVKVAIDPPYAPTPKPRSRV